MGFCFALAVSEQRLAGEFVTEYSAGMNTLIGDGFGWILQFERNL